MPIIVECGTCAAKMKAPDSAAGKKVKCPKCEAILDVPVEGAPAEAAPLQAPPPIPTQSDYSDAPMPSPRKSAARAADYEDDYDDDYEERPRKRKRRRNGGGSSDANNKKMAAGICGILLGALGVHKFILGYSTAGVIMLLISILSCGILSIIPSVIGIVEGIIYLTKSDEEFYDTYIANEKAWF